MPRDGLISKFLKQKEVCVCASACERERERLQTFSTGSTVLIFSALVPNVIMDSNNVLWNKLCFP